MEYNSTKHKELAEELATWWSMQTQFKTKKALAAFLEVHPDTVGDYFSGRKFPRSDTAYRLYELTNITCLKRDTELLKKGMRYSERSIVISLQRTNCPFCGHDIARFRRCVHCGQDFVWANVPLDSQKTCQ